MVGFQGQRRVNEEMHKRNLKIVELHDVHKITFVAIGKRFGLGDAAVFLAYHKAKAEVKVGS